MLDRLIKIFLLIIFGIVNWYCNAPHDNPLDDDNLKGNDVIISGNVYQISNANKMPLQDVRVHLNNDNCDIYTDAKGYYYIKSEKFRSSFVVFEKDGYKKDSLHIDWNTDNAYQINNTLHYTPYLDSVKFFSNVVFDYDNNMIITFPLEFIINSEEPYSDVLLKCDELNIKKIVTKKIGPKYYDTLVVGDFGTNRIGDIINKSFYIKVDFSESKEEIPVPVKITRIINKEIELLSPINNTTLDSTYSQVEFKWTKFTDLFSYHYELNLERGSYPYLTNVFSVSVLQDSIHQVYPISEFGKDQYYWSMTCIDKDGNRSQTRPYSFEVSIKQAFYKNGYKSSYIKY